jgi:transcriptional regulator with XRE-family HTH domain
MNVKADAIADFIKTTRESKNISQKELSVKLGLVDNGQYVSNVERKKSQFPIKRIKDLSQALEVGVDSLVNLMVDDYKNALLKEI